MGIPPALCMLRERVFIPQAIPSRHFSQPCSHLYNSISSKVFSVAPEYAICFLLGLGLVHVGVALDWLHQVMVLTEGRSGIHDHVTQRGRTETQNLQGNLKNRRREWRKYLGSSLENQMMGLGIAEKYSKKTRLYYHELYALFLFSGRQTRNTKACFWSFKNLRIKLKSWENLYNSLILVKCSFLCNTMLLVLSICLQLLSPDNLSSPVKVLPLSIKVFLT